MSAHPHNGRDFSYLTRVPWTKLETEEQAWARQLMRSGLLRMVGSGADRKLALSETPQARGAHTPGPWWVDAKNFAGVETFTVRGQKGAEVASGHHIAPRRKADAQLIAAAPDLLQALEACVAWLPGSTDFDNPADERAFGLIRAEVRAAIAKARGGQ